MVKSIADIGIRGGWRATRRLPIYSMEEIAMARPIRESAHSWAGAAMLLLPLLLLGAATAPAQETPDQFNAVNTETRRYNEVQNKLRNQAHDLRTDQAKGLLQCRGAGSAAAQQACAGNLDLTLRRRGLELDNQRIQQRDNHNLILKGIGVNRVP
jgi:hypothetical protein